MKWVDLIRSLVRPYIAVATITVILVLAIILANKFASADMAKLVVTFILATGATIVGFYYGERAAKK